MTYCGRRIICFFPARPFRAPPVSTSSTQDSVSASPVPGCGSNRLACTERFEAELDRTLQSAPFDPELLREAAQACAHEAKLKQVDVERLIAELGDCLRNRAIPHQTYVELRRLVIGWVLAVYFPAT